MMQRRSFLGAVLAGLVAPAIARTDSLMKLAPLRGMVLWGDGVHDDTKSIQALVGGLPVFRPDGTRVLQLDAGVVRIPLGRYAMSSALIAVSGMTMEHSELIATPEHKGPMIYVPAGVQGASIYGCSIIGNGKGGCLHYELGAR